mmetsp:Transcript_6305/g.17984  ORF Transcript_6305/g.17984 Transcript_6305/m.17984 type:complete len:200 (+) Transcript_6305:609-1208(+)
MAMLMAMLMAMAMAAGRWLAASGSDPATVQGRTTLAMTNDKPKTPPPPLQSPPHWNSFDWPSTSATGARGLPVTSSGSRKRSRGNENDIENENENDNDNDQDRVGITSAPSASWPKRSPYWRPPESSTNRRDTRPSPKRRSGRPSWCSEPTPRNWRRRTHRDRDRNRNRDRNSARNSDRRGYRNRNRSWVGMGRQRKAQ